MERFLGIFKRNPLLIAGAVLLLVLVIWYMQRGGDEPVSGGVVLVGPSDASVEANKEAAIAQMAFNADAARNSAEIELAGIGKDAALALDISARQNAVDLANVAAGVYGKQLDTSVAITTLEKSWDAAMQSDAGSWAYKIAGLDLEAKLDENKSKLAAVTSGDSTNLQLAALEVSSHQSDNAWKYEQTRLEAASVLPWKYEAARTTEAFGRAWDYEMARLQAATGSQSQQEVR